MAGSAAARLPPAHRLALVCAAAVCIASSALLVKASQVEGKVLYSKFSVTLLAESLKLSIACSVWLREIQQRRITDAPPSPSLARSDAVWFTLPGNSPAQPSTAASYTGPRLRGCSRLQRCSTWS